MNKKFLSAILFGALMVTSTGTFVSCKDYDDDIEDLQTQINSLTSQQSTLSSALSSAESTATSAASAAQAAASVAESAADDAEAALAQAQAAAALAEQAAAEAKAEAIEEVMDQVQALIDSQTASKEDLNAVATQISAIDAELVTLSAEIDENAAAIAQLQIQESTIKKYQELYGEDVDTLDEILQSIQSAISALESETADINATLESIADQVAAVNANLVTIQGNQLRSLVFIPDLYVDGVEAARYPYSYGYYFLGVKGAETGTASDGETYAFTKDAVTTFSEQSSSDAYYALAPEAQLKYHVNPSSADLSDVVWDFDELDSEFITRATTSWQANYVSSVKSDGILTVDYTITNADKLKDPATDSKLSVLSLEATLANDTTVNSDYAALVPAIRALKAIAFTTTSKYTTVNECNIGKVELYETAAEAAENEASIGVKYNGGSKELASYLNVHYAQADYEEPADDADCTVMTASEIESWGLSFVFEKVPYTLGSNGTVETAYCTLEEDGTFTPAYVDAAGNPIAIEASESTTGISSVGRMPIVLAKLVDAEGNVVLAGYIKIQIGMDEVVEEAQERSFILSTGNEYGYTCEDETVAITWSEVSSNIYEELGMTRDQFVAKYVADDSEGDGAYILVDGKFKFTQDYGNVYENTDTDDASTTTNVIAWEGGIDAKTAIVEDFEDSTVTLYIKYVNRNNSDDVIYFGIEISIADLPTVTFAQKIDAYWYPTTSEVADRDTVRMNVPHPDVNNDVKVYVKDLDAVFVGDEVTVTLATGDTKLYKASEITYKFVLSSTQPKIGSYQLTCTDGVTLVAGGETIATLDQSTGELTYSNDSDVAKEILNLYSHLDPSTYANVDIQAYYGDCEIPLNSYAFKVRFLRPIDILDGDAAVFEDAETNGSQASLSDLFSLKDWNERIVLNSKYPSGYEEKGVNLYDYYEFETITIDIDNATCDAAGTVMKVSEVTKDIDLSVTDKDGNALGSNTVDISTATELTNTCITYKNNGANVQQFNIWIPIQITYSWGTLEGTISATVKHTIANE